MQLYGGIDFSRHVLGHLDTVELFCLLCNAFIILDFRASLGFSTSYSQLWKDGLVFDCMLSSLVEAERFVHLLLGAIFDF